MSRQNRQYPKTILLQSNLDEGVIGSIQLPFAKTDLDGDLPLRRWADQDVIRGILNEPLGG
jgi:hypothetical protein